MMGIMEPSERAEMDRELAEEGAPFIVCDCCERRIYEGEEYYDVPDWGCICEGCFEDYRFEVRRYV